MHKENKSSNPQSQTHERLPIMDKPSNYGNTLESIKQRNVYMKFGLVLIIMLALTMPFHYVITPNFMIIPKAYPTFYRTIVAKEDIEQIREKYEYGGLIEQIQIRQDPLAQKLLDKGIIRR